MKITTMNGVEIEIYPCRFCSGYDSDRERLKRHEQRHLAISAGLARNAWLQITHAVEVPTDQYVMGHGLKKESIRQPNAPRSRRKHEPEAA